MPPTTIPLASAFPVALQPVVYTPQGSQVSNAVIFLPGLGDTSKNFSSFAQALNLPDTLCVTLQGPFPLPFPLGPGFHWGDDILLDQGTGELEPDAGFSKSTRLIVEDVVETVLIQNHGFSNREIMIFGYGQGGMVALGSAMHPRIAETSLNGIISIGGSIPCSTMLVNGPKRSTPVLLLGGSRGALWADGHSGLKKVQGSFQHVEHHQWKKADDGMPSDRAEALPMMQYFAGRLRSRRGVPGGAVEIG